MMVTWAQISRSANISNEWLIYVSTVYDYILYVSKDSISTLNPAVPKFITIVQILYRRNKESL